MKWVLEFYFQVLFIRGSVVSLSFMFSIIFDTFLLQKEETPAVPEVAESPEPEPIVTKSDIHLSPDRALEEPEYTEDSAEPDFSQLSEVDDGAPQVEIKVEDAEELEEGEIVDNDLPAMLKYKYLEGKVLEFSLSFPLNSVYW